MLEIILKLGAEGGSITIHGVRGSDGLRKYVLEKNEVVLRELLPDEEFEGEAVIESAPVTSWDEAVRLLNQNQNWYRLNPISIHPDFKSRILAQVEAQGGMSVVQKWCQSSVIGRNSEVQESIEHKNEMSIIGALSADKIRNLYEKYFDLIRLEIVEFGVKSTEVRHLIGRLGEFYCALTVDGTLASTANQHGFDVISKSRRKISVKTTAQKTGFIRITSSTLKKVDDLMMIQYKDESLSIIYFGEIMKAVAAAREYPEAGYYELDISKARNISV